MRHRLIVKLTAAIIVAGVTGVAVAQSAGIADAQRAIRLKQFEHAAELLRPLADAGDADAQYLLAGLYRHGRIDGRDSADADALYARAAATGHARSAAALAGAAAPGNEAAADPLERLFAAAARGDLATLETLLDSGIAVDTRSPAGRTALIEASEGGHRQAVDLLLARGAAVDIADPGGETALSKAARADADAVAAALLARGASATPVDRHGNTALHFAARYAGPELTRRLLAAGAAINARNAAGYTPLALAQRRDRGRIATVLRNAGATRTTAARQRGGRSLRGTDGLVNERPVWFIAAERGDLATLRRALADGATDIDQPDASGRTALMIAAERNHSRYVRTLLEAGAALTLEDRNGLSAAHYAARGGHAPLLDGLLAAGMVRGRATLLHLAVASGDLDTVERVLALTGPDVHADGSPGALALAVTLGADVLVDRLLAAGADPLSRDSYGRTPLWHAIGRDDPGLVEKLAAARAIADSDGNTPLHRAAILADLGAIGVLTARGADPQAVNSVGETPLIAALKARQYGTIEALINAGADVNHRNDAGQSALMIAAYRGDDTAATTLLALGADPALQSPDRRNAEDIADELGHTLVVAVLQQY